MMEGRRIHSSIRDSRFETLNGNITVIVGDSTFESHHECNGEAPDRGCRPGGENVDGAKHGLLVNLPVSANLSLAPG
jgi:hypothetical protein